MATTLKKVIANPDSKRSVILKKHGARIDAVSTNLLGLIAAGGILPRAMQSEITVWNQSDPEYVREVKTEFNGILSLSFSPDGRQLAVGGGGHITPGDRENYTRNYTPGIEIWRVPEFQKVAHFGGDLFYVKSISFSRDGRFLLSTNYASPPGAVPSSGMAAVRLWSTSSFKQFAIAEGRRPVCCASFSPDGKFVVFAHPQDATVEVSLGSSKYYTTSSVENPQPLIRTWNLEENSEAPHFTIYKGFVSATAVSPCGRLMATAGSTLTLWDFQERNKIAELTDESSTFRFTHCVAFSPDGKILAAGSGGQFEFGMPWENSGVKLWDVATKTLVAYLVHEAPVRALAFSADGHKLVAGGESELIMWSLDF